MEENRIIKRVSLVTIFGNVLLTVFKMFTGVYGNSGAMVSDAVHSLSDIITTFIAWIGTKLSSKEADRTHPYGHERIECIAALILGIVLLITAGGIGASAINIIIGGEYKVLVISGNITLIAALISILTKEAMYHYTKYYAKKINSTAFMADAWHHRSDALSSVGSLIGIGAAILGFPIFEPMASIIICLCVLKVSYDIIKDSLIKLLDTACSEEFENQIRSLILSHEDVIKLDTLQTRMFGNKIYIDAEISVDKNLSLEDVHFISEQVHDTVENKFENIKHIMIHINPA